MRIDRSHDLLKRRELNFFRASFSAIIKFSKMTEEIWKPVKGYEGYYEVSNFGRVKSIERYVMQGKTLRHVKEKIKKTSIKTWISLYWIKQK